MNSKIEQIIEDRKRNILQRKSPDESIKKSKVSTNVLQDQLYKTIVHTNDKYRRGGSSELLIREDPGEIESFHLRQISNIRGNPWRNLPIQIKLECLREYLETNELIDPITRKPVFITKDFLRKATVKYSTKSQRIVSIVMN
jgi:hypothetical protein